MADAAVIFDVDGVLLELTRAEEDAFFVPFERRYGLKGISRDWNSYAIRNDENIITEILTRHGLPEHEHAAVVADYLEVLKLQLADGTIETSSFREPWSFCKIFTAACKLASPPPISSAPPNFA